MKMFVDFPYEIYKDSANWVPPLRGDEFDTLNRRKNGAFHYCEAEYYLAYKEGKTVGRVAAIVNHRANEIWEEKVVRFGWCDFVEEEAVVEALLKSVAEYGRERGCTVIKGPLGFTDLDKEGLLVEGYEHLSPFTCLYNHPYYDRLLKAIGFEKDVDWTQKMVELPDKMPASFQYAELIEKRYGLHMVQSKNKFAMTRKYGMDLFHLFNESFAPLFEFCPITDKQIRRYLRTYIPIMSPKYIGIVLDKEEEPVGFVFCVPSLSKAVKRSGGRLLPFGMLRILHALRHNDTLESLMIGVLPEYQGKGANVLLFKYIHENCLRNGIKRMILNPELENNIKVQTLFSEYTSHPYMRRRVYKKTL